MHLHFQSKTASFLIKKINFMGIDGYYDNKYKHHEQEYHDHNSYQGFVRSYNLSYILDKIRHNRDLKILVGIIAIILIAIILALLIILTPLVTKLINFISQHGIQGVVDNISGFLDKIWKGAGK
jgi:hypothetical protein